jgi:hypothetical protein
MRVRLFELAAFRDAMASMRSSSCRAATSSGRSRPRGRPTPEHPGAVRASSSRGVCPKAFGTLASASSATSARGSPLVIGPGRGADASRSSPRCSCRCSAERRPCGPPRWSSSRPRSWRATPSPTSACEPLGAAAAAFQVAVVAVALAALPIGVPAWTRPPDGAPVALWLVLVLTAAVGLPFAALATNGPTI